MELLQPGQILGSFRIVRQIGAGGMGTVYEAEHLRLPVRRALKVFAADAAHAAELRKRFVAEGRILSDLQHPRIVRVYDLVVDDAAGLAYFEMDLVCSPDGEPLTLAQVHERGAGEDEIKRWFEDICDGLDYIHSHGVVHRDISADNILIGPDGHAVISDFGIVRIVDDDYRQKINLTVTMVLPIGLEFRMGKERYMAPELKLRGGQSTFATDAWALGVLLFWMLSGSWYDVGTRLEDALAIFDYDWASVIAKLCAAVPSERLPAGGFGAVPGRLRLKDGEPPVVSEWRGWKWTVVVIAAFLALALAALAWKSGRISEDAPKKHAVFPVRTDMSVSAPRGEVWHVVEVTNVVKETVYNIVTFTNEVTVPTTKGEKP